VNAIRFWLGFIGWSAATLLEIPLHAVRRAFDTPDDIHDVFPEEER
jgi:hypothetical protein